MQENEENQIKGDYEKLAQLEALLFIHGEPLAIKRIRAVLGVEKEELKAVLESYHASLGGGARGLSLLTDAPISMLFEEKNWEGKKVQLVTKPQFSSVLEDFVKDELREDLTPASLETLSLIAYLGPISRVKIEYLRGVNSSFILRTLLLRGLIERVPDSDHGGAFLYAPSFELMQSLGVGAKEELPEYASFRDLSSADELKDEQVEEVSAPATGDALSSAQNDSQTFGN